MTIAFFIGLLSALHCFGMCGGIVGALTMSLPAEKRQVGVRLMPYALAYNTGRVISYTFAGVVAGLLGQGLVTLLPQISVLLEVLFFVVVILLGLYVGSWFAHLAFIEKLGMPLWKRIQPIGVKYLPAKKVKDAFLFGLIWGWLPCGLVYYALIMAFAAADLQSSILFMFAFGLGTLIPMLLATILGGRLALIQRSEKLRWFNAIVLVSVGVVGLFLMIFPTILS